MDFYKINFDAGGYIFLNEMTFREIFFWFIFWRGFCDEVSFLVSIEFG